MATRDTEEFETEDAPAKPPDRAKVEKDKHYLNCQIDHLERQLVRN